MGNAPTAIDTNTQRLYWNIYLGLEKEFLRIADMIYVDDTQLKVYSLKIAELLLRTVVEIEAISKDLFDIAGGVANGNMYFDTDCLAFLDEKWRIEKRVVFLKSPHVYLAKDKMTLHPLKDASKRGKCTWKKAYNAVKHNGRTDIKQGNIENFMLSLASLFVLNVYFKCWGNHFPVGKYHEIESYDGSFGSSLFAVKVVNVFKGVTCHGVDVKRGCYDDATGLIRATEKSAEKMAAILVEENAKMNARWELEHKGMPKTQENLEKFGYLNRFTRAVASHREWANYFTTLDYECVLNINQYAEPKESANAKH